MIYLLCFVTVFCVSRWYGNRISSRHSHARLGKFGENEIKQLLKPAERQYSRMSDMFKKALLDKPLSVAEWTNNNRLAQLYLEAEYKAAANTEKYPPEIFYDVY